MLKIRHFYIFKLRPLIISPYHLTEAFQRPETRLFDISPQKTTRHIKRSVYVDVSDLPNLMQEAHCLQFLNENGLSQGAYNVLYTSQFDSRFFYFVFFLVYFGIDQLSIVQCPIELVVEQYPELETSKYLKKSQVRQLGVKGWNSLLTTFADELKIFLLCGESQQFPSQYDEFPVNLYEFMENGLLIDPLALANMIRSICGENKDIIVFGSLKYVGFFLVQSIKPYLHINVQVVRDQIKSRNSLHVTEKP